MSTRRIATGLGFVVALGTPLAALAEGFWQATNDEAGSRIVAPQFGATFNGAPPIAAKPLQPGDISTDRQYVYIGGQGGWQLRPMEYRLENGRLVHVDDPVGHMERHADARPLNEQQREALRRSGGR